MTIQDFIKIDTVYTRSINLERDIDSSAIVKAYIPTTRSLLTLRRIIDTLDKKNTPRSWALIGPYGSGKSSFAVFLAHLLGNPKCESTIIASEVCNKAEKNISNTFKQHIDGTTGYLPVLITGSPEPLGRCLLENLYEAAIRFWKHLSQKPKIIKTLNQAIKKTEITTQKITEIINDLRVTIEEQGGKGLLIVIDELGKFLEYEARHYETNDIYLLQALAELAVTGQKTNIYIFTLMHQGFEQYARGLGEDLRNEWSKIQGRFEQIPFLESTEQTLHVISKAFINNITKSAKSKIAKQCNKIAAILSQEKALPGTLDEHSATRLFVKCYPLHPITALLLPILCQKMAQNERTLFNYIGSKEQFGFRDSMNHIKKIGDWVMPWEVYEYFILNQPAVLTNPTTHRRWAEVVTALERLGDAPDKQVQMLKTIGLFNIIGAQDGFKASENVIHLCNSNKKKVKLATNGLIKKSVILFRKYSNEYRVWQGSDFDIEAAVQEELNQIGRFDLPEALNNIEIIQPIVAHRHTIQKGALRYFTPLFVDMAYYKKVSAAANQQRIIFCLLENSEGLFKAQTNVPSYFNKSDIVALCPDGSKLRETIAEVIALKRVEHNSPELNSDSVAQRELKDRLAAAERLQEDVLSALIETPANAEWYYQNQHLTINTKKDLQITLSDFLDKIYKDAPIIKNELINKNKPSAQATAARNKLVFSMLHNMEKQDLGINKFPAEKSIYKAFFHATGLHKEVSKGTWNLLPPDKNNSYNFYPVWKKIEDFLETTSQTSKSFAELNTILQEPPYGIKTGVLPLLYLSVFLCNQEKLAFFEDGVYIPYITDQHIERFMKRPNYFTVQHFQISGIRATLFQQYAQVLYGEHSNKKATLLSITKPLAHFIANLEGYTKNTNRISDASQKVLKAFDVAKSPIDLLFKRLPKACGYSTIDPNETNSNKSEGFTVSLVRVIQELRDAYSKMIDDFSTIMSKNLLPHTNKKLHLSELREKVRSLYEELAQYTIDTQGLRLFIEHLSEKKATDNVWFSRILLFLGGRAPEKWSDIDREGALLKLKDLSRRLIDLHVLQANYMQSKSKFDDDFDIILLRTMRYRQSEHEKIIKIDKATKKYLDQQKSEFHSLLSNLNSDKVRLALLADLVDEYLSKKEVKSKNNNDLTEKKIANGCK